MSIATELTLLANSKQAIKNSINQKGGSITDSTPFADYSTAIDNLPSGGSGNPLLTSIDVSDFTGTTFDIVAKYITDVTIPSGVTSIAQFSLQNCTSLTSVTIPSGVTTIGQGALQNCTSLTRLTIPDSVTSIGNNAFAGCASLTSVAIPNNLTSIAQECFYNCTSLTSVTIPSGVTTIGQGAFKACRSLTDIEFPSTVTSIGLTSFNECSSLTSIIVNATTPPTMNSAAFERTNNCPIYVPAESVDAYKAANNWSSYASRIYPIQQVATVDGNPVYNYDIGNTDSTVISDNQRSKIPTGDSIEFAEGVTQIGGQLGAYEEVVLPSTFLSFDDTQPINAATTTLTSKATTPPSVERSNLGGSGLTAIYVPASAVDTYKENATWSSFASIIQAIPTE